jgi:hypothetical protein
LNTLEGDPVQLGREVGDHKSGMDGGLDGWMTDRRQKAESGIRKGELGNGKGEDGNRGVVNFLNLCNELRER